MATHSEHHEHTDDDGTHVEQTVTETTSSTDDAHAESTGTSTESESTDDAATVTPAD